MGNIALLWIDCLIKGLAEKGYLQYLGRLKELEELDPHHLLFGGEKFYKIHFNMNIIFFLLWGFGVLGDFHKWFFQKIRCFV